MSSGQAVLDLQLQTNSDFTGYEMFLLYVDNTDATGRKLAVGKTFNRRPGHLNFVCWMYVLFPRVSTFCESDSQSEYKLHANERNLNIAIPGGLFLYMVEVDPIWNWGSTVPAIEYQLY